MKEDRKTQSKVDDTNKRHFDDARNSQDSSKSSDLRITFFNESHYSDALIDDYEKVLMIAIEFEIATQLSFLKELIRGFNRSKIRTRNIHLI